MLSMLKAGQSSITWNVVISPGTPQSLSIQLTFDTSGMATAIGSEGNAPLTYIVSSSIFPSFPLAFFATPVPFTPPLPYSLTYWGACNATAGAGWCSNGSGPWAPFSMSIAGS